MLFGEGHINAFKRVLSDPARYGVEIRPMADCVEPCPKWMPMSGIITRIYFEYNKSIPLTILVQAFYEKFSDLTVEDDRGEVMCKLKYIRPVRKAY